MRKIFQMDLGMPILLAVLFAMGISVGIQYQRLETNRTQASLEKALDESAELRKSEAYYKRGFETMQAGLGLLKEGPQSPLSRAIQQGCLKSCEDFQVMAVDLRHALAIKTKGTECSGIRMPEPVFVQQPPLPGFYRVTDPAFVCETAALFATHSPFP